MITAKQDRFVQEWLVTGNKSEAYRRAYNAKNMTDKTIHESASELSQHPKVSARYAELTEAAQKRNDTTVDTIDRMLKEAYYIARVAVMPSAMVGAVMGLARLHGLDAESRRKVSSAENNNSMAGKL